MSRYTGKFEFMEALRTTLNENKVEDINDILADFEQHFEEGAANGLTEQDVCDKLGSVEEIVSQYISENNSTGASVNDDSVDSAPAKAENADIIPAEPVSTENANTAANNNYTNSYSSTDTNTTSGQNTYGQNSTSFSVDAGAVVGRICVDVFVFSWAIPTLASLIISFLSMAVAFVGVGIASIVYSISAELVGLFASSFVTPFGTFTGIFLGIALIALAVLCGLLGRLMIIGFINMIKSIINWHSRCFVGRDVVGKTEKKTNVGFVIACVVSGIIFVLSLAGFIGGIFVEGVDKDKAWAFGFQFVAEPIDEHNEFIFNDDIAAAVDTVEINISSCDTVIEKSANDKINVYYEASSNKYVKFDCHVQDNKLIVDEDTSNMWFVISFLPHNNDLRIELPEKQYNEFILHSISGDTKVENLVANSIRVTSVSGDGEYNIFADRISFSSTSGDNTVANCTDKACSELYIKTISGSNTVKGFKSENFTFTSTSGNTKLEGISGKGICKSTSGNVTIDYAEWNDDLEITATSGNYKVNIPENSGVEFEVKKISGIIRAEYGDTKLTLDNGNGATVGSGNMHKIKVDISSGSVDINIAKAA